MAFDDPPHPVGLGKALGSQELNPALKIQVRRLQFTDNKPSLQLEQFCYKNLSNFFGSLHIVAIPILGFLLGRFYFGLMSIVMLRTAREGLEKRT